MTLNFPTYNAYVRLLDRHMRVCLCVFELLLMHIYSLIRSSIKCLCRFRKLHTEFYRVCLLQHQFHSNLSGRNVEIWSFGTDVVL